MATPIATGIHDDYLGIVWPNAWRVLEPVWKMSLDRPNILAQLKSRDAQMWVVYDGPRLIAGIVTRLNRVGTSGDLRCRVWLVGGSRMSEWAGDFIPKLKVWARSEGCSHIDGAGRKGWARIMARLGFTKVGPEDDLTLWELAL